MLGAVSGDRGVIPDRLLLTMLRFSKQNDPGNVRMPTMSVMPSPEDLQFILSQAQRNWRRAVELSFKTPGGSQLFTIAVQCEMGSGEPVWTLTRQGALGAQVAWTHTSQDVRLIHNLIAPEFHGTGAGQAAGAENAAALASVESTNGDKSGEAATAQKGGEEGEEEATGELDSDTLAIQSVFRSLCRPETGLFTYPAFLYFVDQEWRRFRRGGLPFSLMIFQISYREVDVRVSSKPLSIEAIHEAALRITATKRDLDLLAHYGAFDFAVLLPHTEADGAAVFAGRVQQALTASPLVPGLSADGTMLYGGIAQMPGDSDRPRPLIGAALEAKKWAVSGPSNIVLYRDLYRR